MFYSRFPSLLLTGSLVLLATAAHAQASFSIGPRVGLNLATYRFAEPPPYGTPGYRAGLEAGIASTVGFGHIALQAAVLYSQKGTTIKGEVDIHTASNTSAVIGDYESKNRLNYITIPLALAYTQHRDGQGAQVFAGPYLGLLLSGNYALQVTSQSTAPITISGQITPVNSDAPDSGVYARRFDAGLQAGLGYRYQALLFQASYSLGLRNTSTSYTYNGAMVTRAAAYNRAFQASLTYLFGPKS